MRAATTIPPMTDPAAIPATVPFDTLQKSVSCFTCMRIITHPESLGVTVVMAVTVLIPFPPPVRVVVPLPVCVPVDEGAAGVEEGDKSFKQLASDDDPTV